MCVAVVSGYMAVNLPKSTSDDKHLADDSKQSENKHFAGMAAKVTEATSDDTHLAGGYKDPQGGNDESSGGQHSAGKRLKHPAASSSGQGHPSADGSVVNDGEYVYVLTLRQIRQIDHFHGTLLDLGPVAQMMEDEADILASEMISTRHDGRTVRAIITLQRIVRFGLCRRGKKSASGGQHSAGKRLKRPAASSSGQGHSSADGSVLNDGEYE